MNADAWIVPEWPVPLTVRAVVTTRNGPGFSKPPFDRFNLGSRCGDDPQVVAQNRARLCEALELPSPPRWLRQVHGTKVVAFDGPRPDLPPQVGEGEKQPCAVSHSASARGRGHETRADGGEHAKDLPRECEADAALARTPGVVLAILTADCLPVLLCAEDGSEIAAAHAGWRGLSAGVLEDTIAAMRAPRDEILAWLGPAVGPRSYEVGDEVREAFVMHDSAAAEAFRPTRPGHWRCDLTALGRQRLRVAGVARIFGGGFDTFADQRFYSYRRDGARSGRFASLIWLDDQNSR